MMNWKIGDHAMVTGDRAEWRHRFEPGTEVVLELLGPDEGDGEAWLCKPVEPTKIVTWWVGPLDLAPIVVDPQEIEGAVASIKDSVSRVTRDAPA